jgi:parallel beta-helix repeat protein
LTPKSLYRFTLVFAISASGIASATTRYANNNSRINSCPGTYNSISAAVAASSSGDTVIVCTGVYNEQVSIISSPTLTSLTLSGQSGATIHPTNAVVNTNDGVPTVAILYISGVTTTVSGLIIDGSLANTNFGCGTDFIGIYLSSASGTIAHNVARFIEEPPGLEGCQNTLAIYADMLAGGTHSVTIEANSVHDFDKNGITVGGVGLTAAITGNTVVGLGPTALTAQNGIQFGPDGSGTISGNIVSGFVYSPCISPTDGSCDNGSATGILPYDPDAASGTSLTITKNTIGQSQGGIYTYYDGEYGSSDATYSITQNEVSDTLVFDGIGVGSSNSTVTGNTVVNSAESGIALYSSPNTVNANTIIEAPVGILIAAAGNPAPSSNKAIDVVQAVQTAIPSAAHFRQAKPFARTNNR